MNAVLKTRHRLRPGKPAPKPTRRQIRLHDMLRHRIEKQIGRLLFWRFGITKAATVCPAPRDNETLVGWYLPGGESLIFRLREDRSGGLILHNMQLRPFRAADANSVLLAACDELLGGWREADPMLPTVAGEPNGPEPAQAAK